jgi:hypothetical protein
LVDQEKTRRSGALAAYEQPKRLVTLPSGHFDAYVAGFEVAWGAATEWFVQHLISTGLSRQ